MLIGGLITAWLVALLGERGLRRRLHRLRETADALGRGEVSRHIDCAPEDDFVKLAESLDRITDQLKAKCREEDRLRRQLTRSEQLALIGELAAVVAHEINNPLTVISGRAQLLLREETDPERRHALALISAQARRVHEMIADMMLFARPPCPELQEVDVTELIDEIVAEFRPGCERQQTLLRVVGEKAGPVLVEADPVQLGMAIRAICRNAVEALQSGGTIEIAVETAHDTVSYAADLTEAAPLDERSATRIRISDDGPGIAPEERRHLFDPFYSARQAGRGLGLGLSKAWRIVTNHRGRIEVESRPGHGSVFTIFLPPLGRRD